MTNIFTVRLALFAFVVLAFAAVFGGGMYDGA